MKTLKILLTLFVSILLFSCLGNDQLKSTYTASDNAFFEKLTLKSGNNLEIVFIGTTIEADYRLEDDKVMINSAVETQILNITEKGCLDGGGFIGTYCKD